MTAPDFRALCEELAEELDDWVAGYLENDLPDDCTIAAQAMIHRARAALAQPVEAPDPGFRALLEEVAEQAEMHVSPYLSHADAWHQFLDRISAALDQPVEAPSDEELIKTAQHALDGYRYSTELPYFLSDDSCEYEPFLLILRAVLALQSNPPPPPPPNELQISSKLGVQRNLLVPAIPRAIPADDWDEDDGPCLWWRFPIEEPPYVGDPLCDDWPGYHTHFTRIVCPEAPAP